MPILTVVIPAYKAERFIGPLLDNLVEQILSESLSCEVILVNDGSPDSTRIICEEYSQRYPFIKLINKDNQGVSSSRNIGIKNASGKYIYFLDSDDTITRGTLSYYIRTIQNKQNIDLYCYCYTSTVDWVTSHIYCNKKLDGRTLNREEFQKKYFTKYLPVHVCSCVIKKELIEKCQLHFSEDLTIGEDIEWLLNVFSVINTVYYSNRNCYIYQIRNDSAMQGYKVFSKKHWHSYEVRRDLCLSADYQNDLIKKYSNFFLKNEYLSHFIRFLKSNCNEPEIINNFIKDKYILSLPSVNGALKNTIAVRMARFLPLKLIINLFKRRWPN